MREKALRIGLLTYFWEDDPGQFFQALATFQELQRQFPNAVVEVVDVRHWGARWRLGKRMLLTPQLAWKKYQQHKAYEKGRALMRISQAACYAPERAVAAQFLHAQNYDVLVVGSDVTLRPLPRYMDKDELPIYWLPPDVPGLHVMLASSADTLRIDQLTERQKVQAQEALHRFSFITVRDEMTFDLIKSLADQGKKAFYRVPDSTFAYSLDSAKDAVHLNKMIPSSPRPLCAIHLPLTPFTTQLVRLLSSEFDLVVIRGHRWPQSHHLDTMPPMLWRSMFTRFSCVITVSLHECIFSLKNGVPAFALDVKSHRIDAQLNRSKTKCLMEEMELPHHHFSPYAGDDPEEVFEKIRTGMRTFDRYAIAKRVREQGDLFRAAVKDLHSHIVGERRFD